MDLVKYCKAEHNIRENCNTLQLGTFSYYRNMDPSFSIADGEEGTVRYRCQMPEGTEITSVEFNAITGGGVTIHDKNSPSGTTPRPVGAVKFSATGSEFVGGEDGVTRIKPGLIESELSYPNCYIFCCSIHESGGDEPDPAHVSEDYDSFYRIPGQSVNDFATALADLVKPSINLRDICLDDERIADSHISTLGLPYNVQCLHGPVEYKKQTELRLESVKDFEESAWSSIFFKSMFWKNAKYSSDKEYRFVMVLEHPTHRFLPVVEAPKILQLNRINSLLK